MKNQFGSALRDKPLKNDGMKPLKIQNCISSTKCKKRKLQSEVTERSSSTDEVKHGPVSSEGTAIAA
ncbi:MAG: hypothetical protein ABI851_11625 [Saprospiraceae bacterium]